MTARDPGGRDDATVREAAYDYDEFSVPCPTCEAPQWVVCSNPWQASETHRSRIVEAVLAAVLAALDLPARDAKVRVEALREAADDADRAVVTGLETTRPDRVAVWLRRRADAALASAGPVEPAPAAEETPRYVLDHGFTPHTGNPFSDGTKCRVQLARYPCPYPREKHDPSLPPENVDVFGRRRCAGEPLTGGEG